MEKYNVRMVSIWRQIKICCVFLIVFKTVSAQDYTQTQNRIKSIYVYNFIKDIQLPALASNEEDVKICLLEKTGLFAEMEKLAVSKKVNNRKLSIQQVTSLQTCKSCHVVFVEEGENIKRDQDCNSLVITSGFYDKSLSSIVLMFQDNKLQFSINSPLCEKIGVKISSHLMSLANQKIIQP